MRALVLCLALVAVGGCQKKMDPETAKKLLIEKMWKTPKQQCNWQGVHRATDTGYLLSGESDAMVRQCVDALRAAGLLEVGQCIEKLSSGECYKRPVEAKGGSWLGADFYLSFWCADVGLPEIKSVTTENNRATVIYERDVTLDSALLGKLAMCKLEKPVAGRGEKTRTFHRDDAGAWILDDK